MKVGVDNSTNNVVHVRPLQQGDGPDVARIWMAGLEQSKSAVPWFLQRWFMNGMRKNLGQALSETGDVGPDGSNLMKTYTRADRRMMVATYGDPPVVVGCCAVKRGMNETELEPDSDIGSIWRMSVDETYRGLGIATKLMAACEDHAKTNLGCSRMGLWTINPVAAKFYMNRMQYKKEEEFYFFDYWIARQFIPPVCKYTKSI